MADPRLLMAELRALVVQRIHMEESNMAAEQEFLEVVKNFEEVRKKWLRTELELKKYKELLVKSDVSKAALEIKLKHARNQLEVEMRKRCKIEADCENLNRQMQLMCDILIQDSKSTFLLNDEQKSILATFESRRCSTMLYRSTKRLSIIDEPSFLSHSDISYDRTDDDVDLDSTLIAPLRSRARERRRSSMGPVVGGPVGRPHMSGNAYSELQRRRTVDREVETNVKALLRTPGAGGQTHMVLGITQESPDDPVQSITQECAVSFRGGNDQMPLCHSSKTLVKVQPPVKERIFSVIALQKRTLKHEFQSKTVIRPETCAPCGKRIRFGKIAVKCKNCRLVAHPECEKKVPNGCTHSAL